MRRDQVFELRRCQGFFEIIRSAKLHGLEIAVHLQATRQHHHRCVPVACQSKLHEVVRFKGRATLAHDDEVERLVFQAALRLLVICIMPYRVTQVAHQSCEIRQVSFVLINQQGPSTGKGRV